MKLRTATAITMGLVLGAFDLAGCDTGTSDGLVGVGGANGVGGVGAGGVGAGGVGGDNAIGGASGALTQAGSSPISPDALTMDGTGRVEKSSNAFGIQGSWYWYADFSDGHAGLTQLPDAKVDVAPYVEGKGMCVDGKTPGGASDNYVTWGAGIGLNLNQGTEEAGGVTPQKLSPYPKCFAVTLSADSSSPGGILGKLLEANPMPGTTADATLPQEAPSVALKPGKTTDVCVDSVAQPTWCTGAGHQPGDCADPKNLADGIAGIQIQALAGAAGGNIHVCVLSIVPKN